MAVMIDWVRKIHSWYKYKLMLRVAKKTSVISSRAILLRTVNYSFAKKRSDKCVFIDDDSVVGCNFIFESDEGKISIGKRVYIGSGTNLISRSSIDIGDDVTIAWGVYLYDHDSHSLDWRERVKDINAVYNDCKYRKGFCFSKDWSTVETASIKINSKAWIGFNAIILKGVTIGEGAVVGAGAVVTKDVLPYTVVAGNPAKVVKMLQPEEKD